MQETREMWVQSLGREDPLEQEMATHSSILAWRILWTVEPGGLQSMGSHRVGYDCMHTAEAGWQKVLFNLKGDSGCGQSLGA